MQRQGPQYSVSDGVLLPQLVFCGTAPIWFADAGFAGGACSFRPLRPCMAVSGGEQAVRQKPCHNQSRHVPPSCRKEKPSHAEHHEPHTHAQRQPGHPFPGLCPYRHRAIGPRRAVVRYLFAPAQGARRVFWWARSTTRPPTWWWRSCCFSKAKTPTRTFRSTSTRPAAASRPACRSTTPCSSSSLTCPPCVWALLPAWAHSCWRPAPRASVIPCPIPRS
jgi:hypothetical protein